MSEERLSQFYEEKYRKEAVAEDEAPLAVPAHPQGRFEGAVATLTGRLTGCDVLELGAGSGLIAKSVAGAGTDFRSWTLSDWAQTRIEGMRNRLSSEPRFCFAVVDASHPEKALAGQKFDAVVAIALIEHLVDPLCAFAEVSTLLRPGGFVYIDTPNIAKWTRRIKLAFGRFPSTSSQAQGLVTYDGQPVSLHDEGHLHYFTYGSLEKMLLDRCGFHRVERVPYGIGGRLGPRMSNVLARRLPTLFSDVSIIAYV